MGGIKARLKIGRAEPLALFSPGKWCIHIACGSCTTASAWHLKQPCTWRVTAATPAQPNTQKLISCHPHSAASAYTPSPFPAPVPAPPTCKEVFSTSFAKANKGGSAEWIHGFSFAWKSTASTKTSGKRQGWGTGEAMSVVSAQFAKSVMSQGDSRSQPKQ